jgi:hypothetical protein
MDEIALADDANDLALIVHDRNGADPSLEEQLGDLLHRSRGLHGDDRRNHHVTCLHGEPPLLDIA